MDDCIFCKIISGEEKCHAVYRDAMVMAFMDISPITPGHMLIVPIEHATGLTDLHSYVGTQMFQQAQILSEAVKKHSEVKGVNFYLADGAAAGQEVMHIHMHIIPRYENDGFRMKVPPHPPTSDSDLAAAADMIRQFMGAF